MSADISAEEAGISWKLTALVDRSAAEAALAASVEDAWDSDLVMSAHEVEAEDRLRLEGHHVRLYGCQGL